MPLRTIYTGKLPRGIQYVLSSGRGGFSVSSNFARSMAPLVALAASQGWISTVATDGSAYSPVWSITTAGLTMLEHNEW